MLNYSPSGTLLVGSDTQLFIKSSNIKDPTKMMTRTVTQYCDFLFFTPQGLILQVPSPTLLTEASRNRKLLARDVIHERAL